jgi:hypothetical protein
LTVEKKKGETRKHEAKERETERDGKSYSSSLRAALLNNFVVGICHNPTNWARRRRRRQSKVRKKRSSVQVRERERERERERDCEYLPTCQAQKGTYSSK